MKKTVGLLVLVIMLSFLCGNAAAISFDAKVAHTGNQAKVKLGDLYTGWVYTEYTLETSLYGDLDAFCVQDAYASKYTETYELMPVPASLYAAAWVAEQFWNGWAYSKEDTQVAIWELALDGTINLGSGNFIYYSGANAANVAAILALDFGIPSFNVAWAVNSDFQNYLVKNPTPVPEPATMLLLGIGLLGCAGLKRRITRKI